MKKILFILIAIILGTSLVEAQLMYPSDSIPAFLRAGAKAVIRSGQVKILVKDDKQIEFGGKNGNYTVE